MAVSVLFLGEIVGKAGVYCVKSALGELKSEFQVDLVIANADGATGGFGLGKNHSVYLKKLGVDVITGGDQIYYKKDMVSHISRSPFILRPANFPSGNPGRGWRVFNAGNHRIGVINLLGLSGFPRVHLSNPYTFLPELVSRVRQETDTVLVDFHAMTTSEKRIMQEHADGTVAAVFGTGQRSLTADAGSSTNRTATITDAGRTGSIQSIGGLEPGTELEHYLTQVPLRSKETWEGLEIQGVVVELEEDGRARDIQTIRRSVEAPDSPSDTANRSDGKSDQKPDRQKNEKVQAAATGAARRSS